MTLPTCPSHPSLKGNKGLHMLSGESDSGPGQGSRVGCQSDTESKLQEQATSYRGCRTG
jgi:hypothetical protein